MASKNSHNYTEPDDMANAILEVEGTKLHVNKELLMIASPVFKTMFNSQFVEAETLTVMLPDKKLQEVKLLLDYIYPDAEMFLTDAQAVKLIPLAHEYQMPILMKQCSAVLMKMENPRLEIVTVAQKYGLEKLQDLAINACAQMIRSSNAGLVAPIHRSRSSIADQVKLPENRDISEGSLYLIYKKKLQLVGKNAQEVEADINNGIAQLNLLTQKGISRETAEGLSKAKQSLQKTGFNNNLF